MFQVNWEYFLPIEKKFGTGNRTQFCIEKKPWFLTRSDKNRPVQPKKETKSLKMNILEEEGLYYPL